MHLIKPTACLPLLAMSLFLPLTACSNPMNDRPHPEYRENPSPQQAYEFRMRIQDPPGPFGSIVALAQYDVRNRECLPPPKENPGGYQSPLPTRDLEIPLRQEADGTYVGRFHVDAMLDEDYHGRGICQWQFMQVRAHLRATGADGETYFIPRLLPEDVLAEASKTYYFRRDTYPEVDAPRNYTNSGVPHRPTHIEENELFSVAIAAHKE